MRKLIFAVGACEVKEKKAGYQQAGKTKGVTILPAKLLNLVLVTAVLGLCSYTPGETSKIHAGDGVFHIYKVQVLGMV